MRYTVLVLIRTRWEAVDEATTDRDKADNIARAWLAKGRHVRIEVELDR